MVNKPDFLNEKHPGGGFFLRIPSSGVLIGKVLNLAVNIQNSN